MGYFTRQLTATRTPPARTSGADTGGVTEGVCHGGTILAVITGVTVVVVCVLAKKHRKRFFL